eukprot:11879509-Alexandrium_andersonii.AAC.1
MRSQVSAGACAEATSPSPLNWATAPRPTRRNQLSPFTSAAVSGPQVMSCSTDATPPELTSAVLQAP